MNNENEGRGTRMIIVRAKRVTDTIHHSPFTIHRGTKVPPQPHPPQVEQSWVQSSEKSVVSGS